MVKNSRYVQYLMERRVQRADIVNKEEQPSFLEMLGAGALGCLMTGTLYLSVQIVWAWWRAQI